MRNGSDKVEEKTKIQIFTFFVKSRRLWDMWKNMVQPGGPQIRFLFLENRAVYEIKVEKYMNNR